MSLEWVEVCPMNPRDIDLEPGDVGILGDDVVRLEESRGWGKRMLGDLTPRKLPDQQVRRENGVVLVHLRVPS